MDNAGTKGGFIPQHGGYQKLRSFQTARLVYDCTVVFCERFVPKTSRTNDQMVQAARSGVQNIAEGSLASATSKETEIKLTNVARASLGELLLDYQDYLRQHGLQIWALSDTRTQQLRSTLASSSTQSADIIRAASSEAAANLMLCAINQAMCLLKRQIDSLQKNFLEQGGLRERMTAARRDSRNTPISSR